MFDDFSSTRRIAKTEGNVEIQGADKSLARPASRCVLFDGKNISFDASLVIYIYIYSTNIPPIMIVNRIYTGVLISP